MSSRAKSRSGFDYLISDIRECDRAAISGLMGRSSPHPLARLKDVLQRKDEFVPFNSALLSAISTEHLTPMNPNDCFT